MSCDVAVLEKLKLFCLTLFSRVSEKLLVVLRDGRTLIGFLRAIDQFGKLNLFKTRI